HFHTCNTVYSVICFFFSSRRRHTRFSRDWSSDVCSSDLPCSTTACSCSAIRRPTPRPTAPATTRDSPWWPRRWSNRSTAPSPPKIGRASCRERVEISGWSVDQKKDNYNQSTREKEAQSRL